MYQKCCEEKHVDLLLIGEEDKKHYILNDDFNTVLYDHGLHCGKNTFLLIVYKVLVQQKY